MSNIINKTTCPLDLGAFGEQEVTIRYTFSGGLPEIISDHWGGVPAEPPCVEVLSATFLGKDVLPLITEDAMDWVVDHCLSVEGVL